MPAMQIVMSMGDREARGWVQNEMFLSMPGRRRLTAGSLSRLMGREGTDDDIEALLDYLSIQAEHHLRIFDAPVQQAGQEDGEGGATKDLVTVNVADLAPVAEEFRIKQRSSTARPHTETRSTSRWKRNCPPEDCGGRWGYQELVAALADPEHQKYQNWIEMIGEGFDPEEFSAETADAIVAARFGRE